MPSCVAGARRHVRRARRRRAGHHALTCATPATSTSSPPAASLRNSATQHLHAQRHQHADTLGHSRRHHDPQRLPVLGRHRAAPPTRTVTLNGTPSPRRAPSRATYQRRHPAYPFFGDFANVTSIVNATRQRQLHVRRPHREHRLAALRQQHLAGGWALIVIYESADRAAARHQRVRRPRLLLRQPAHADSRRLPRAAHQHRRPHRRVHARRRSGATPTTHERRRRSAALQRQPARRRHRTWRAASRPCSSSTAPSTRRASRPATASTSTSTTSARCSSPGQTSGTTLYSAGADLVLLMAQIVSATSDPAVDLGVTMSHSGTFVAGSTGQYTITVSNAARHGARRQHRHGDRHAARGPHVQLRAAAPAGAAAPSGQVVTCTHAPTLNAGASFPPLTLTVNVLETAAASRRPTASR